MKFLASDGMEPDTKNKIQCLGWDQTPALLFASRASRPLHHQGRVRIGLTFKCSDEKGPNGSHHSSHGQAKKKYFGPRFIFSNTIMRRRKAKHVNGGFIFDCGEVRGRRGPVGHLSQGQNIGEKRVKCVPIYSNNV